MADDTRVVQMQFDNKDFEKNISTSQRSLERFKGALDFGETSKGLEKFGRSVKAMTFDSLANNIQKLTDKFTGLGTASEFVLSKIRQKLEQMGSMAMNFVDSMTTVQMSAGFAKYESLNKAVQTLKSATGKEEQEVYAVLERLNKYTDETSYDFAEGVTSIAKLVSSGAADMATAEKTVEGFFNLAAKAGADTAAASHALQYAINQAMGTGYMGLNDWKTLENLSIGTIDFKNQLLEAAVAVGTVVKEGEKYYTSTKKNTKAKKKEVNATNLFRESLSEQWITTDVLNKALGKYQDTTTEFGAEAYAAAQRCTTFTDALNAWKDQLSTGWMNTYRTVFGDLTDAMNLFSAVCNKVAGSLDSLITTRNNVLEAWKDLGGRENLFGALFGELETPDGETLFAGAYGLLDVIGEIGGTISDAFWNTFANLIPRDQQQRILAEVNKNLQALGLEKPFESFEELWNSDFFISSGGRKSFLGGALQGITEDFQNMIGGLHEWFDEVDDNGVSRMQKIQNVMDAVGRTISFVIEGIGGLIHFFGVLADENHLGPSLDAISNLLSELATNITGAENDISNSNGIIAFFDSLAEVLQPACDIINTVVASITELVSAMVEGEQTNGTFGGTLSTIADVFKKVFGVITNVAKPIAEFIHDLSTILGELFKNGFDEQSMAEAKTKLSAAFTKMWEGLGEAVAPVLDKIKAFFKLVWDTIKSKVTEYFNDPNSIGNKILGPLKVVFGPVINFFTQTFENLKKVFTDGEGNIKQMTVFEVLGDLLNMAVQSLSKVNLWTVARMIAGGYTVYKVIKTIRSVSGVADGLNELIGKLQNPLGWLTGGLLGGKEESFVDGFSAFAKAVAILTGAIFVLGNMDVGSALKGLGLIAALMLSFIGIKKLMSILKVDDIKMAGFVGFAVSLGILVAALRPLAGMSWEQFGKMMAGLGGLLTELIGFMLLTSYLPIGTAQLGSFIGFAVAIGILIASLQMLKNMSWEQFGKMMAGLGGVLVELIGFMLLTSYLPVGTGQLGGFIGFAISIGVLIMALQPLKDMDWGQFGKMMAGLGGVLLQLIGFMLLTSLLSVQTAQLGSFIGFAASLWLLIETIKPFADMNWEQYGRVMAGLGGVLVELIGFMLLTSYLPIGTVQLGPFIGFAASLWLLIEAIKPFADMNWEQYGRVMAGLGGVLAQMVGFMLLTSYLPIGTVQLGPFIGFAASLWLLVTALKPFADMNWEQYGRTMAGLAGILAQLLTTMLIVNAIPVNPAGIAAAITIALGISVLALALSASLAQIRNVKWEVITAFTAGLATSLLAMAGAIVILSAIPFGAGIKGIALLAAGIGIIVGEIALLAPMLMGAIGDGLTGLGGKLELVAGMLTSFSSKLGTVDEGNIDKATSIFGKLRTLMNQLNGWGKFIGNTNDFTYSMFALGTSMEIFNNHVGRNVTDLDTNAQATLKFIQDLSGCANDLDTISKMNMDNLVVAIAELGGAMSIYAYGAKQIQGMLGEGEGPDQTTVGASIQILKDISTGLAEAGGFTIPENMPDDQQLTLFGASLAALATALVQFEQAGSGLGGGTEKALQCFDFFKSLKDKLLQQDFMEGIGAAIGIFKENDLNKDKLTEFGANIEQLGLAMKTFNESTTILDEASGEQKPIDFSNAVGTLDSLVELQGKLGWDFGPVIQFFAGRKKNFLDLGVEIEGLGTALKDFTEKLGGVDEAGQPKLDTTLFESAITISDKIVEYMRVMQQKMSRVGGLWNIVSTIFAGKTFDFTDLKTQLTSLAEGLGGLGQLKVDDKLITVNDTKGIFKVLDGVVEYLNRLKTEQGKVGGLINDISDFFVEGYDFDFVALKGQLTALGEGLSGLSTFSSEDLPTKEEMTDIVFPMVDVLTAYLTKLKEEMDPVGGLANEINSFFGTGYDFDFKALKEQLTALGDGLGSISGVVVDSEGKTLFNEEGRGDAIKTIDALLDYMQTLSGRLGRIGGIAEFFNDLWNGKEADFQFVGTQLGYLGEGLGKFSAGITANGAFDATKTSEALGALDHLVSMMQTFSVLDEKMDAISQSYGLSSYNMKDFFINMWDSLHYMTEGADGRGSAVQLLAEFVKEFDFQLGELGGLQNAGSADILNTVAQSISNLVTAARNMQNEDGTMVDFQMVGQNISNGIAVGIAQATGVVEAAARAVVRAAVNAANAEADSHSPSRVFMTVGGFMGQGLAIGFSDQQGIVENAATEVTDSAIEGATNAMSLFTQLMSQDIDANPTITPVIDLSNITAGSAAINNMLGGDKELSLSGAGGDYSEKTIPGNNGTSGDYRGQDLSFINTAIQGLGARIDAMGAKISQMQIVMNTGALVGQVTDGINRNLGQKTIYGRRRN